MCVSVYAHIGTYVCVYIIQHLLLASNLASYLPQRVRGSGEPVSERHTGGPAYPSGSHQGAGLLPVACTLPQLSLQVWYR